MGNYKEKKSKKKKKLPADIPVFWFFLLPNHPCLFHKLALLVGYLLLVVPLHCLLLLDHFYYCLTLHITKALKK